jgi:hypothetical protein
LHFITHTTVGRTPEGRGTGPSQRPLPDNTNTVQETNIHAPGGIRTHNPSKRLAADLRLRPRDHWDRLNLVQYDIHNLYFPFHLSQKFCFCLCFLFIYRTLEDNNVWNKIIYENKRPIWLWDALRSIIDGVQPATSPKVQRPRRQVDYTQLSSADLQELVELYLHSPVRPHDVHKESFTFRR